MTIRDIPAVSHGDAPVHVSTVDGPDNAGPVGPLTSTELAERIDKNAGEVSKAATGALLEFMDGLDTKDAHALSLARLDKLSIDNKFKDLAILGLLMRDAPTLTPAKMGANLKETLEKMPELRQHFDTRMASVQRSSAPRVGFIGMPKIETGTKDKPFRSEIAVLDMPTGFVLREDGRESKTTLMVKNTPFQGMGALGSYGFRLGLGGGSDSYEVPLSAVPTSLLEEALAKIPAKPETNNAMGAMFEANGTDASERVRFAIKNELEIRDLDPKNPARRLEAVIDSIEKAS